MDGSMVRPGGLRGPAGSLLGRSPGASRFPLRAVKPTERTVNGAGFFCYHPCLHTRLFSTVHHGMKEFATIKVIGGGLAGCEAAWQAAERGVRVLLYEMRPLRSTGAHRTGNLAELVCSNSLKSNEANTAPRLLKDELR